MHPLQGEVVRLKEKLAVAEHNVESSHALGERYRADLQALSAPPEMLAALEKILASPADANVLKTTLKASMTQPLSLAPFPSTPRGT